DPPLIHSLGVATADNELDVFLPKGTALPARKRRGHRTAQFIPKGQAGGVIPPPVMEGENLPRAHRNRLIRPPAVKARELPRDVPALSDVEITIEVDASRLLSVRAYVPLLDRQFDQVIRFDRGEPDVAKLRQEVAAEKERLAGFRSRAREVDNEAAARALRRIDEERLLADLD